jgi:hypothetical protein
MIRGSPSSCHRSALTVLAVAVCVLSPLSATAQTRTHFASSITAEPIRIANFFQKRDYRFNVRHDIRKPEDLRGKESLSAIPGMELSRRVAMESVSVAEKIPTQTSRVPHEN